MVFTLQRYIFRELLRIFILATIGLTLILSLGLGLSMAQEYGVGPRQTLHILVYVMPVTLTFVLPMAALFASALAYGRFAGDNELDACRASGISVLTLVYPGLALAILVAIGNLLLSFHVMPYFVHLAEKSLKADAKQILFRNIQRKGFYNVPGGRYLIYADLADLKTDTLHGIVVVQASDEGIKRVYTLGAARVRFDLHDKYNEVHLATYDVRRMGAPTDDISVQIGGGSYTLEFGSLLGDDIKFKKIDEMKRIRADLMLFDPIARLAQTVYTQLVTELLARDIEDRLAASPDGCYELNGPSLGVRFSAARCELRDLAAVALVPVTPPVVVEEQNRRSGISRKLLCQKAELCVQEGTPRPDLSLRLQNPQVEETGQLLAQYAVTGLAVPDGIARCLGGGPMLQTVTADIAALVGRPPSPILDGQQRELLDEIADALTDIRAEINSRLVFGIGCVPMILIGIGLGIIQRGGHLLSAFGASCLPAAVLIVTIISGKNLTKNAGLQNSTGILIMWAGLAFLMLLTAVIYRKLRRS